MALTKLHRVLAALSAIGLKYKTSIQQQNEGPMIIMMFFFVVVFFLFVCLVICFPVQTSTMTECFGDHLNCLCDIYNGGATYTLQLQSQDYLPHCDKTWLGRAAAHEWNECSPFI